VQALGLPPGGVDEVRKLAGTPAARGPLGEGRDAGDSVALHRAGGRRGKLGPTLVDNRDLVRRIERVRATEPRPECATPMLLDRSARGWWLRCPRCPDHGCRAKRGLGDDPGRAIELLPSAG